MQLGLVARLPFLFDLAIPGAPIHIKILMRPDRRLAAPVDFGTTESGTM
jgi:hypothetical protein